MDKLLKSNWFVKIIAFLLALMLYTIVSMETQQQTTNRSIWTKISTSSETLNNMQITPYFNQQKYVLTDLPPSVDVTLSGSSGLITKATKVDRSIEVYIDLTHATPGTQRVKVQVRNLPDGLKANVTPSYVQITLHKRVTKELPVNIDLKNVHQLPQGYTAGDVEFSPKTVRVTGAEDMINDISFITGFIDVGRSKDTIQTKVPLRAYNLQGDIVDVDLHPQMADIRVPISKPAKTVPVSVSQTGQLPDGLTLKSITVDPKEVTITGPSSVLNNINSLDGLQVDLSKITQDTSVDMDLPVPAGVDASAKKVTVHVAVEKTNTSRTFQNIPIKVLGLKQGNKASIVDPQGGLATVTVTGQKSVIDGMNKTDLQAFVDVSNMDTGQHAVKVSWKSPNNVTMNSSAAEATVDIQTEQSVNS